MLNAETQSFRGLHYEIWRTQRAADTTCKGRKAKRSLSVNSANALALLFKLSIMLILCASAFNNSTSDT